MDCKKNELMGGGGLRQISHSLWITIFLWVMCGLCEVGHVLTQGPVANMRLRLWCRPVHTVKPLLCGSNTA